LADDVVRDPVPVLGRRAVQAHVRAVLVVHETRGVVLVLGGQMPLEPVWRLDDVVIHADEDEIVALHGSLLAAGTATGIHPAAPWKVRPAGCGSRE
jgi:hypothetical protein